MGNSKSRRIGSIALYILIGLIVGYLLHGDASTPPATVDDTGKTAETPPQQILWTCSMHPQVLQDKPGLCPICHMELIPLETDDAAVSEREFTTSEAAAALMDIQTTPVERRSVEASIRMVGKVTYDETRLGYITAWVPGRLDRLYVDYTGVTVKKGDHMVYMYSPELITAQEELRRAAQAVRQVSAGSPDIVQRAARDTLEATRRKLRLWGLTDAQINAAEQAQSISDHITLTAPIGGTVVALNAQQGMYVSVGTRIYTISDLTHLWVKLDAYEQDLPWVRYGQKVEFETEAYPGDLFEGWIAFVDPVLDQTTRTVKVRVNVPNPEGKLKPGMFVRGVVRSRVARGGRVIDENLAGKWICPMHPEIVKDESGTCDLCGMPLVRAEALGYVPATSGDAAEPLVIPATAPLITGKRAVVYVQLPDRDRPTFEGREIVLGPRAGDYYLVKEGLDEGEQVVTHGNFKIDSALQIQAKPSMMAPSRDDPMRSMTNDAGPPDPMAMPAPEIPEAFRVAVQPVLSAYLDIQTALAADDAGAANAAVVAAKNALINPGEPVLPETVQQTWSDLTAGIGSALDEMARAKDIEALRSGFGVLSEAMGGAVERFGLTLPDAFYQVQCPMAFEWRGATWLQTGENIRNPYFGESMLECGTVLKRFGQNHMTGESGERGSDPSDHAEHAHGQ